ncbi:MAG TPA: hypothetical protein DHW76_09825 [Clostridiaceae bacterium]|jgi:hypothetical protein|nr:hypothetical protein [Clostridiaceae bacterium]HCL51280.1 hypothetical protein [Clostridiaceae bacterium]
MKDINIIPDEIIVIRSKHKRIINYILISLIIFFLLYLPYLHLEKYKALLSNKVNKTNQIDKEQIIKADTLEMMQNFINEYNDIYNNRNLFYEDVKNFYELKSENLYIDSIVLNKSIKISGCSSNFDSIINFTQKLKLNSNYKKVEILSVSFSNGLNRFIIQIDKIGSE